MNATSEIPESPDTKSTKTAHAWLIPDLILNSAHLKIAGTLLTVNAVHCVNNIIKRQNGNKGVGSTVIRTEATRLSNRGQR